MKSALTFFAAAAACFLVSVNAATAPKESPAPAPAPSAVYWGSSKSDVYHNPSCASAKRITDANRVTFSSKEEAAKKGYRACKICKP